MSTEQRDTAQPLTKKEMDEWLRWPGNEKLKEIHNLKAHAQRLAEAAKQVERDWHITRRKNLPSSIATLREALAAWEGAQP